MKNILFSASDPGGGNALLPLLKHFPKSSSIIGGPSKNLWEKQNCSYIDGEEISEKEIKALFEKNHYDLFVFATSSGDTIEKKIFPIAKKAGVKSLSILDFWSYYWQRYSGKEKDFRYLPDIICLPSEQALSDMLEEGFPRSVLKVTGNPYFQEFTKGVELKGQDPKRVLFISQPFSELEQNEPKYGNPKFNEIKVASDLSLALKNAGTDHSLIIRVHPKGDPQKFNSLLGPKVKLSKEPNIEKDLSRAGVIIGMDSPVLLQATLAGKKVLSYHPEEPNKDSSGKSQGSGVPLISGRERLKENFQNNFRAIPNVKLELLDNAAEKILKLIQTL